MYFYDYSNFVFIRLLFIVKMIRLGSLPERPYPTLSLIGEGISKILGKNFLPAILLIPYTQQERDRSFIG